MKNFFRTLLLISFFSSAIYSCTKIPGPEAPVIILTAPTDTTTIVSGSQVHVMGSASDNKNLHEFYFNIKNNVTDSVYHFWNPYVHGAKVFPFDFYSYRLDSGVYTLSIKALDHDGHTTIKELLLNVN